MKLRLIISPVVVLLSLAICSSSVGQKPTGRPVNSTEPQPLTSLPKSVLDAELKAPSGGSFEIANYSGKVMVLNLWAAWCGPCRLQIASLVKFHDQFRAQGVEVIGLSTENAEASAESVSNFIRDYQINYQVGWATPDVSVTLMQARDAIPQTFVISRSGRIVKRFIGFNSTETPPKLTLAIEEALNERPDPPKQN